jgi:uncharacterized protein YjiS (DUF1127 family)
MNTPFYYGSVGVMNASHLYGARRGGPAGRFVVALAAAFERLFDWQKRRAERDRLGRLDERLLRDIGLSSADVAGEVEKPFWRG